MFSWVGRSKDSPPVVLGFGKIPAVAEYVRAGPKSPASAAFEDWVVSAVEWAAQWRADRWKGVFDSAAAQSFVCRASGSHGGILAGVMRPSHDAVGRKFPLVICTLVPASALASNPHLTPMLFEDFFQRAGSLLLTAGQSRRPADFQSLVASIQAPELSRLESLNADYQAWSKSALASDLFERCFAHAPIEAAVHALRTILEAAAPLRGQQALRTTLSVRVPLATESRLHGSFWLDVLRLATASKQTALGWFCGQGATGWSMLAQLGDQPHMSLLADVWAADSDSDNVCDLNSCPESTSYLAPLPTALEEVLRDPDSSIADVLGLLTSGS